MNAQELIALAERVEALDGPDREVDAEIALATSIVRERDGDCFYGHRDYSVMVLERGYHDHDGSAPELPAFTASLDAVIAQVGDLPWRIEEQPSIGPHAIVGDQEGFAVTPTLAALAALLRARASRVQP